MDPEDLKTLRACTLDQLLWFLEQAREAVRLGLRGHRQTVRAIKRELRKREYPPGCLK